MQIGLKKAESTLAAASSLLSKLAGEKASWQQQADVLTQALPGLPASSVMAAACVVYATAVPEDIRMELMRAWRSIVGMESREAFSLPQFLSKGGELSEWAAWGLPTDQVQLLHLHEQTLCCRTYHPPFSGLLQYAVHIQTTQLACSCSVFLVLLMSAPLVRE